VFARAAGAIHLRALLEAHGHTVVARELHQRVEPLAVAPARYEHAIERAARFERLAHSVNSGQAFHDNSKANS
jgi:hypothetical protein